MDNRKAQLIRALTAKQGGVGGGGRPMGGYGGALPTYGVATSPFGLGGMFSSPIGFNPFAAQSGMGFAGLVGPSQAPPAAAAAPAAVGSPTPADTSAPSPIQGPAGGGAAGGSPAPSSTTPPTEPAAGSGFYGSGDDAQAQTAVANADNTGGPGQSSQFSPLVSLLMMHYLAGRDPMA